MPLYKITSPSGKIYIGITVRTVKRRMQGHMAVAKLGSAYPLHAAIMKYGFDKMQIVTLNETCNFNELRSLEVAAIAKFNCMAPNGYNLTAGGEGTLNHFVSDENKKQLSARMSARWLNPEFRAMRIKSASKLARSMTLAQHATLTAGAAAYWSNPENHSRRTIATRQLRLSNPERFINQTAEALIAYNKSDEGRAAKSKSTALARAAQSPEKRSAIGKLGGGNSAANRKTFLESLSPEAREVEIARFKAERSAATKAGRAAATPEQKAASKERYRQAALRRTIHPRKLKAK